MHELMHRTGPRPIRAARNQRGEAGGRRRRPPPVESVVDQIYAGIANEMLFWSVDRPRSCATGGLDLDLMKC